MDQLGIGMAAVALVLFGVWLIARQGEREAPVLHQTTPLLRRLGLVSIVVSIAALVVALIQLIDGAPGRSIWYAVFGAISIASGRTWRRTSGTA